ncbi:hypothetical protein C8R43DRAFT_945974 [Mycena crocata]|nr:hypothetical protein C8R43DRAFT_945974 [Mycena crocata]
MTGWGNEVQLLYSGLPILLMFSIDSAMETMAYYNIVRARSSKFPASRYFSPVLIFAPASSIGSTVFSEQLIPWLDSSHPPGNSLYSTFMSSDLFNSYTTGRLHCTVVIATFAHGYYQLHPFNNLFRVCLIFSVPLLCALADLVRFPLLADYPV